MEKNVKLERWKMSSKGTLLVLSGFSGAGKGTIVKKLVSEYDYHISISATTRAPRTGEVDGREYYFKTRDEFQDLINHNGLIEWAEYVGNYYGTPKQFVEEKLAQGKNVILEIEVQGALNVKKQYPEAVLIFIAPPSIPILRERLIGRGTEDRETIEKRLLRAKEEAKDIKAYEYIVMNDELDACVKQVHQIIMSTQCKVEYQEQFLDTLTLELKNLEKAI